MLTKQNIRLITVFLMIAMIMSFSSVVAFANNQSTTKGGSNREIPTVEMNKGDKKSVSQVNLGALDNTEDDSVWDTIFVQYGNVIAGLSGIAALTMIAVFIVHLMKLAASATNPSERSRATTGILWSGIATAGLGAVTLFVGFFYNAI